MSTEQEEFWAGDFGNTYTERNKGNPANTRAFFNNALAAIDESVRPEVKSVLELGANVGHNLMALRKVFPEATMAGVEINETAYKRLVQNVDLPIFGSLLEIEFLPAAYDFILTKGVLIHIAPDDLLRAYEVIRNAAARWVLMAEYFCPEPREIHYRGHDGKLWARDFAGEFMTQYPEMRLVDYGFIYHRDRFPQDNVTWFLMEKGEITEAQQATDNQGDGE